MAGINRGDILDLVTINPNDIISVPESVNQVLKLDLLREMILERVLLYQSLFPKNLETDIRSLRLVSPTWRHSMSKILCKTSTPLIKFNLKDATNLDNFVKMFCEEYPPSSRTSQNAPTFSLDLSSEFFLTGSYPSLQNCLLNCGKKLAELEVYLDTTVNLPFHFPTFNLAILKRLKITVRKAYMINATLVEPHSENRSQELFRNCNVIIGNFAKAILEGSAKLKELVLFADILEPLGFSGFIFPQTITTLYIRMNEENSILDLMSKTLPILSTLHLEIFGIGITHEHVFNVVTKWSKTLTKLSLRFSPSMFLMQEPGQQFGFPVMENLEELDFNGVISSRFDNLQLCFPKLKKLHLIVTRSDLEKWTRNSLFSLVTELSVELYEHPYAYQEILPMSLENTKNMNKTFPNLKKLALTVLGSESCVVRYIFKEMQNLTKLELKVVGTGIITNADFWDALLIGAIPHVVNISRESGLDLQNGDFVENVSIKNLKGLEVLHLESFGATRNSSDALLLISKMAFTHGFLKMPNLKLLALSGRFKITAEMLASFGVQLPEQLVVI